VPVGAVWCIISPAFVVLEIGQQKMHLGNNWATNISKKEVLGNKKEKNVTLQMYLFQTDRKQEKGNYFPIQKFLNIYPSFSSTEI